MTTSAIAPRRAGPDISLQQQRARAAFWFLVPMLLMLAFVAAWPLMRSIMLSFSDASADNIFIGDWNWVGFENYLERRVRDNGEVRWRGVLADPDWWNAVWNTVRFSFISVTLETTLGLLVALVLNAEFKGRGLVRAAILVPWAIPTIVSAKMWGWMLNDQYGIINSILLNMGLIDAPIAWTARPDTAMVAVLIVDVWKTTPFMALLMLAGLLDDLARYVRGGAAGRHPPGQGVLEGDAAAAQTGHHGGGDLPPSGRAAHL